MNKLIDKPLGSLAVIDDTICEVVKTTFPGSCAGCLLYNVLEICQRFACADFERSDMNDVILRPIEID